MDDTRFAPRSLAAASGRTDTSRDFGVPLSNGGADTPFSLGVSGRAWLLTALAFASRYLTRETREYSSRSNAFLATLSLLGRISFSGSLAGSGRYGI